MAGAAALHDKSGIVHLLKTTIGATVTVVDASAEAAVAVLQAGGNATIAVSSVFVDALSVSSSVLEDAWQGIDIHNVLATRRVGRLISANASVALDWLNASGPTQVGNASMRIAKSMSILLEAATPYAEFEDSHFDPRGLLVSWYAKGRVFEDKGVTIAFVVTETTFTPVWSNPVWQQLEYDVKTEATRILRLAGSVSKALPNAHDDATALIHPGALFDGNKSNAWHRRAGALCATAAATVGCLACAWVFEPVRTIAHNCWERCAAFLPSGEPAFAEGEGVPWTHVESADVAGTSASMADLVERTNSSGSLGSQA